MSGFVSNSASVLSRCGVLEGQLSGDRGSCVQFRSLVREPLSAGDGAARVEVERFYTGAGETMTAAVQVLEGLSKFLRAAAGRVVEVDTAAAGASVPVVGG